MLLEEKGWCRTRPMQGNTLVPISSPPRKIGIGPWLREAREHPAVEPFCYDVIQCPL